MLDIPQLLSRELKLHPPHVQNALKLHMEGGTVPFIARYRKERTGSMDETQLRTLFDRFNYLTELEDRKSTILSSIEGQGKLTDELRARIEGTLVKTELEDLYLPYKPKQRTRATVAREKDLAPLAEFIASLNIPESPATSFEEEAAKYISAEKGVQSVQDALAGAADILAEEVSEKAELRAHVRDYLMKEAWFVSKVKENFAAGTTKFEMYREFKVRVKDIQPHNMLALLRGQTEGVLTFSLQFDEEVVQQYLESRELRSRAPHVAGFYKTMLRDAFERLMRTSLETDVRAEKKQQADLVSIRTFEENLRELLLSSPAGMKPTIGIDPGFRTGCKICVINDTGKVLHHEAIFPHQSDAQRQKAGETLRDLITNHAIELIAIGNGTAGRETDEFVGEVLKNMEKPPIKVMANESGASVYSASHVAKEEFPDLDVTVRGAISIARRLQDPLAELVKIDPKSIGVGQYQHDVDQKLLRKKLEETVQSCVNYVGVDLNLASAELLKYVSGLNKTVARNIVKHREDHGAFRNREQLHHVPKFGEKTFEQAAGFLRIRNGENPLDNSAVHPESYGVVEKVLGDLNVTIDRISEVAGKLQSLDVNRYVTGSIGEPTLRDIVAELQKPGRDPRAEFRYARFQDGIKGLNDLKPGMELEGVVTNVANFGAFVDIGVHHDGLVHVSQLADRYVRDPTAVVKVGQIVHVRVLEVNEALKRISLSMKSAAAAAPTPAQGTRTEQKRKVKKSGEGGREKKREEKRERHFTLDDLKEKFGSR